MDEVEFKNWAKVRWKITAQRKISKLDDWAQEVVAKMHADVFRHKHHTPCKSCPKVWLQYIDDLEKLYYAEMKQRRLAQKSK